MENELTIKRFTDVRVSLWRSIETVQHQIEHDFTGACIPLQAKIKPKESAKNRGFQVLAKKAVET